MWEKVNDMGNCLVICVPVFCMWIKKCKWWFQKAGCVCVCVYWHPKLNGIFPEINDTACVCRQAPNLQASHCDALKHYPGNGCLFALSLISLYCWVWWLWARNCCLFSCWPMPLHWPQANKNEGGKVGKCGPPWGIIAVYNVTRKESSCEQRQQIPCSNFTILLNEPSNAQGGVCRADFSGINIVSSFQWLHEPAGRNGQLNPGAGCYNDCISNKLNSVKVCFQARGSGWLYRLVVGTRHCSCHEPICTASSSPQTGFGSQLGAGTVPSTQLGCSCRFLCQVALLPETGPRPVSFINLGVFHISGAPRSCGCLCWWGVRLPMGNWFCDLKKQINKLSCWFKQDTALKMGLPVNISARLRSVTISSKSLNLRPKIAWDS